MTAKPLQLSRAEFALIERIAARAIAVYRRLHIKVAKLDIILDLQAVHCSIQSLRLNEMAEAPDADLIHDVSGIHRHLDREKLELGGYFLPRYASHRARGG